MKKVFTEIGFGNDTFFQLKLKMGIASIEFQNL